MAFRCVIIRHFKSTPRHSLQYGIVDDLSSKESYAFSGQLAKLLRNMWSPMRGMLSRRPTRWRPK